MLTCPNCGEDFRYGHPNPSQLMLKLLFAGKWRCSKCGVVIVSDCKVIKRTIEEMDEIAQEVIDADIRL